MHELYSGEKSQYRRELLLSGHRYMTENYVLVLRNKIWWVQQALLDFKERICKYEEVYETITDRNMHYIKLIDMCAELHPNASGKMFSR